MHLNRNLPPQSPSPDQQCQVSESPDLQAVARQFIKANQAPWRSEQEV